jgi:precorrin-4/cobalt-precorrin-4 C11-methyltransferase
MPEGEDLAKLGASGATLAIHLSVNNLVKVVRDLTPHYGADGPVVIAYRVGWPDQQFIHGALSSIREKVKKSGITRTALILVGHVLDPEKFDDSRLYAADHHHVLRPKKTIPN